MENLDLQFRPVAEFMLDFIHQSPHYALDSKGREGKFTRYSYNEEFVLTRVLYTLYRVEFVSLDIYVDYEAACTKLRLVFDVRTSFPFMRIECNIADGFQTSIQSSYID